SLLRYWPKVNSPKEVMFVNELEGIMDVIEPAQFTSICQPLFQQLVKCIVSPHFQIAERTLGMWRNNYFVNLITDNIHLILPIALSGIYRHSRSHWNRNIHNQVYQILRFFVNVNEDLFEQCLSDFRHQRDQERKRARKNVNWWTAVEKIAMEKKAESNPTSPTNAFALNADASLKQPLTSPAPLANPTANPTASPTIPVAATTDSMDSGAVSPAGDSNKDVTPVGSVPPATSESENKAAAEEPDRWGLLPSEMPMSKLDDPETMNIEMEEDEFIRELDKFVDIIKAEDPDSSMTNGMMMLDESDGSGIVDEVLGAAGQNVYSYSQQMQIQQQHYEQQQQQHQHAAMLHNMANGSDQMNGHIIMDPTSMHVDYASSIMASTEAANPIAPTPLQSNAFPSEAYLQHQQQHYVGHDGSIHGGIDVSPNNIQMTSSIALHQGISNVSMSDDSSSASSLSPVAIVSPIPGGGSSGSPVQEPTDETRHDAPPVSTGAMDLSSTPPPQHFA
ncbi:serine/threonine-protein phosphatase 2A 56 kDa regulatory subunit delta isoform, partial [Kickxella alabastrina]